MSGMGKVKVFGGLTVLLLCLSLLLLAWLGFLPGRSLWPELRDEPSFATRRCIEAAEREIERLGKDHAWAGVYHKICILDHGESRCDRKITLAPEAGYAHEGRGLLLLDGEGRGRVHERDGLLTLSGFFGQSPPSGLEGELIPVRWAEMRFLVPVSELREFVECSFRHMGSPAWFCPRYFTRKGMPSLPPGSRPELPEPWAGAFDVLDIEARITKVISTEFIEDGKGDRYRTQVSLDVGREQDAFDDMPLTVRHLDSKSVRVERISVARERSIAEILHDGRDPVPEVGWVLVRAVVELGPIRIL